jgi:hypothetical protein
MSRGVRYLNPMRLMTRVDGGDVWLQ